MQYGLTFTEEEQKDYERAKEKLVARMTPEEFVSLDEFHLRKVRPGEALPLFLRDLKRLLDQAMPKLDATAREQLLLHQFVAGLPEPVSSKLRATGETKKLETTVERARLLMTLESNPTQPAAAIDSSRTEVEGLRDQIAELTQQVTALTAQQPGAARRRQPPARLCFGCGQPGHLQRNCPNRRLRLRNAGRPCWTCGLPGHLARDCQQGNEYGAPAWGNRRPLPQ